MNRDEVENSMDDPGADDGGWTDVPQNGEAAIGGEGKASGKATAALVLGIVSIVLDLPVCCCGIFGIPFGGIGFILGIVAAILGYTEKLAIDRGEADPAGTGQAKAGMILGIIGAILTLVLIGLAILMMALNIGLNGMQGMQNASFN